MSTRARGTYLLIHKKVRALISQIVISIVTDGLEIVIMSKKVATFPMSLDRIARQIFIVRGQRVMLDADLAAIYGATTGALNQAVRRNRARFPEEFAFRHTPQEFAELKSQFATSNDGRGGRRKLPWAFTEHGVAMLTSVLRSTAAIRVNVEIVRAFIRLRRLMATPGEFVAQLTALAETVQLHDHQIKAIVDALQNLMAPPAERPKGRFGFHMPEKSTAVNSPQEQLA